MVQTQQALKVKTWYAFTRANLNLVPAVSGVYWLGVDNNVIYIGSSVDLASRLADHYVTSDPYLKRANQFAVEPCSNFRQRERELLQAYLSSEGRLPDCNDSVP